MLWAQNKETQTKKEKRFTPEEKIRIVRDANQRGNVLKTYPELNISDVTFPFETPVRQMNFSEARQLVASRFFGVAASAGAGIR